MFHQLTQQELLDIIECEELSELQKKWGNKKWARLFAATNAQIKLEDPKAISRTMITAINTAMTPINLWWLLIGTFNAILGAAALMASLLVIGSGFLVGLVYFCYSYENKLIAREKIVAGMKLDYLKINALNVLIESKKTDVEKLESEVSSKVFLDEKSENNTTVQSDAKSSSPSIKPEEVSVMKSVLIGTGVGTALVISYGFGISSIFETLGLIALAGALTGPAGIGIAIAVTLVAIGIGVYLGYKHYEGLQAKANNKAAKAMLTAQVKEKQDEFEALKKKSQKLQFVKKIESSIDGKIQIALAAQQQKGISVTPAPLSPRPGLTLFPAPLSRQATDLMTLPSQIHAETPRIH
jgi:hypothetical protein